MTGGSRSAKPALAVQELIEDESLQVELMVAGGSAGLERMIRQPRIQKSGLALAGHFHGIEPDRIQILGVTELSYLKTLSVGQCQEAVRGFFERDLCCVIVTARQQTMGSPSAAREALIDCADRSGTTLLLSEGRSSKTILAVHALLNERLAPRQRIHGVLVDVFEVGLLLLGSSGVGKSEVGLELIMRGHRLVADDVVECHYRPPGMVFGAAADLLRHHIEVRGLGILNIKDLFGVTAVRERKRIDVVVRLVEEPSVGHTDRLGLDERFSHLLGVDIRELLIPVRPGRDMASIMEIAARNELLKNAGHFPAHDFFSRLEGALIGPPESEIPGESNRPRSPSRHAPRAPESSIGLPFVRKPE